MHTEIEPHVLLIADRVPTSTRLRPLKNHDLIPSLISATLSYHFRLTFVYLRQTIKRALCKTPPKLVRFQTL